MIRVLLVDDSPLAIAILKRMLSKSTEIEVAGTAANGKEALKIIPQINPDVVCTDLHMPVMDGLELIKEIMANYPLPILVVSVSGREGSINAFKAIEAGALDIFLKPTGGADVDQDKLAADLIMKIRILSAVQVFKKNRTDNAFVPVSGITAETEMIPSISAVRILVIGASTGGPKALEDILSILPGNFPLPVICIQHISEGFQQGMIDWLASKCRMKIEIAEAGTFPRPGIIYFPPEDTQLKIDGAGKFLVTSEPLFDGHRPSVTVTMKSVAGYYKSSALGVLLTGMGKDGAEGMFSIKKAGGITIAQNEESCIIFGMPKQAIELGAAVYIVPLNEIGPMILNYTMHNPKMKI
ncbi:MAG: chemotaxis response regulator protein-glutamate methylesterase [Spirochaetae bacterium HGW-Spirochaetae-5]|nr:MAG: chemotaxis response regulator protein-glutamate methylesterase [Spirochaetae bacterium HGW-Spirochaetae-5]